MLDRVVFTDFTLCSVFTANSRLAKVVTAKFAAWQRVCAALCVWGGGAKTNKQALNLSVHQDGGRPSIWIPEILDTDAGNAERSVSCHHEQIPRSRICSITST
jgi:hypothetical protein